MDIINELYVILNTPQNSVYVLVGFAGLCLLAIALRIVVCVNYGAQLALFNLNNKEIKQKSDIRDTRCALLNKATSDYIKIGDKGVAPRTAKNVVDKHISRMSFIGWSYDSMGNFVSSIERNAVFLGIILTVVFEDYRYVFAIVTVAAFIIIRLVAAIFDYTVLKQRLSLEISEYIEREVGQFYAGDSSTLLVRLRNELAAAIQKQGTTMSEAVDKMGNDLAGAVRLYMAQMIKSVDTTMTRVSNFGGELSAPLEKWKAEIGAAALVQNQMANTFKGLGGVAGNLKEVSEAMAQETRLYVEAVKSQGGLVGRQIEELKAVAQGLKESNTPLMTANHALQEQLKFVERNQELLEKSLQRYELTMEEIARRTGDGLGSIIEYHMQTAYGALNKSLEDNIDKIVRENGELINRLNKLFTQMLEQGSSEAQAILKIKEQMDIHFEDLKAGR